MTRSSRAPACRAGAARDEQRFRAMADAAPAMLWVSNPDGSAMWLSQGWRDYAGRTRDPKPAPSAGPRPCTRTTATRRRSAILRGMRGASRSHRLSLETARRRIPLGPMPGGRASRDQRRVPRLCRLVIDINDRKQARRRSRRPTAARTSSWRRWPTSCATRWRRSATRCEILERADGDARRRAAARRHDGAAGRPDGAAGRRPARREPHQPGQARAAQGAGRAGARSCTHAVETVPPARCEACGHELTVDAAAGADLPGRRPDAAGAGVREPAQQRRASTPTRGGRIWLTAEREGGEAVVARAGHRHRHRRRPAAAHLRDVHAGRHGRWSASQGGLGIGLTLVQAAGRDARRHGRGPQRRPGPGQRVRRPPAGRQRGRAPPPPAPAGRRRAQAAPRPRRILVVDDNRDAADSLAMLLQLGGHEVRTAHDGLEAVEAAAAFRPDVVLLDIGLPKLNGYEAARRIREQPWGRRRAAGRPDRLGPGGGPPPLAGGRLRRTTWSSRWIRRRWRSCWLPRSLAL